MSRIAVAVIGLLAAAGPVHADATSDATKLFAKGRALVEQGKQAEACVAFDQSFALDPLPGTALNVADCAEQAGQLRAAWRLFDNAAREFEAANKLVQAKFARDRASAIAPKLAIVIVRLAAPSLPGLVVTIGGREMPGGVEIVERLDAGPVVVEVRAPGRQPYRRIAAGVVGRHTVVDVPALAVAVPTAGGTRDDPPADAGRRQRRRVLIAGATGGAGVVAVLASGFYGLRAQAAKRDAFDGTCRDTSDGVVCETAQDAGKLRDAGSHADTATVLGVVGGALVAAGVVLYVTAPRESLVVTPTASPTGGGISISGTF